MDLGNHSWKGTCLYTGDLLYQVLYKHCPVLRSLHTISFNPLQTLGAILLFWFLNLTNPQFPHLQDGEVSVSSGFVRNE